MIAMESTVLRRPFRRTSHFKDSVTNGNASSGGLTSDEARNRLEKMGLTRCRTHPTIRYEMH
jgi:hypothetical protein